MGNHSETIQIKYDPAEISYAKLLDIFWDSHNPTRPSWSRQYASIIFYHDDEQRRLAEETKGREEIKRGEIFTEIVPTSRFYLAEAYHQKYRLQQSQSLVNAFRAIYPNDNEFLYTTAAARVNGYLGGHGIYQTLKAELDELDLPAEKREKLLEAVRSLSYR